jgi:hypothetical protein
LSDMGGWRAGDWGIGRSGRGRGGVQSARERGKTLDAAGGALHPGTADGQLRNAQDLLRPVETTAPILVRIQQSAGPVGRHHQQLAPKAELGAWLLQEPACVDRAGLRIAERSLENSQRQTAATGQARHIPVLEGESLEIVPPIVTPHNRGCQTGTIQQNLDPEASEAMRETRIQLRPSGGANQGAGVDLLQSHPGDPAGAAVE